MSNGTAFHQHIWQVSINFANRVLGMWLVCQLNLKIEDSKCNRTVRSTKQHRLTKASDQ